MIWDLKNNCQLGKAIEKVNSFCISPCSRFVFWTRWDEGERVSEVCRRTLDGGAAQEKLVFKDPTPKHWVGVSPTMLGDHIIIVTGPHEYTGLWMLSGTNPEGTPMLLAGKRKGMRS